MLAAAQCAQASGLPACINVMLLTLKNRSQLSRPELLRLLPILAVGMLAGVTLLVQVSERGLLMGLGAFVVAYAVWSLLSRALPAPISSRFGGAGGPDRRCVHR